MQSLETKSLLVDTSRITLRLNYQEFEQLCQDNPYLRLQLTANGELVTIAPTGLESSGKNGDLFGQVWYWNFKNKQGKVFDSSGGLTLPSGAVRSPDVTWIEKSKFEHISFDFTFPLKELLVEIGDELAKTKPVLIIDKAQSIPVTLRNHAEQWIDRSVPILLVATLPQGRELYLKFPRWKLKPLSYWDSYRLVKELAIQKNIELSSHQIRAIASKGNGNPQLLLRAVNEKSIDLETEVDAATDWIDLTPVVLVILCLLIVLRYIGQGVNNSNLVIMGGLAAVVARIGYMLSTKVSKKQSQIQ